MWGGVGREPRPGWGPGAFLEEGAGNTPGQGPTLLPHLPQLTLGPTSTLPPPFPVTAPPQSGEQVGPHSPRARN